jgi:signal transduction histidine kinase
MNGIIGTADALLTLLNDILDLSKMEAGKLDLDQMNFDLRKSMVEVAKTPAIRAQEKGLDFIFDVSPEVPANVVGDPARLRQVLVNLIGNAVKCTERGEVEVNVQMDEQSRDGIAFQHDEEKLFRFGVRPEPVACTKKILFHFGFAFCCLPFFIYTLTYGSGIRP